MKRLSRISAAKPSLETLFTILKNRGYKLLGPTVRDEAIVYDELSTVDDLPVGIIDEQDGGHYRLKNRDDQAFFGFNHGPHTFKQFLHVPYQKLWSATRSKDGKFVIRAEITEPERYAFIGVRSCEIHAIEIQDRVLLNDKYPDLHYQARRDDNLVIAVNCSQAAGTCFCSSMNTGPKADSGFDLAITELLDGDVHQFLLESGSTAGDEILEAVEGDNPTEKDFNRAKAVTENTTKQMGRHLDAENVHDLLLDNYHHSRWDEVAARCLSCGNCTLVCPTCFCTSSTDTNGLGGNEATHSRQWDSCFTPDFSYMHGGSVRQSTASRYRQWITHKLATWIDQFGSSGCVGCGRCITWCPVGIDITQEVKAIAESEGEI